MSYFPVKYSLSRLLLNRADFFSVLGKNDDGLGASLHVRADGKVLELEVLGADQDELQLTAQDASQLSIDPLTIVKGASSEFLKADLTLENHGKELPFHGKLLLVPRRLMVNARDAADQGLIKNQSVFVASRGTWTTIFGDVIVGETSGMSYCALSKPEAEGALLKENDLVYLARSGNAQAAVAAQVNRLPERFIPMERTPGRSQFIWITEKDVWQAILKKKLIWVPKNAKLTPAARDLGIARKIFEFEP